MIVQPLKEPAITILQIHVKLLPLLVPKLQSYVLLVNRTAGVDAHWKTEYAAGRLEKARPAACRVTKPHPVFSYFR